VCGKVFSMGGGGRKPDIITSMALHKSLRGISDSEDNDGDKFHVRHPNKYLALSAPDYHSATSLSAIIRAL
jgi:hypothetical protein